MYFQKGHSSELAEKRTLKISLLEAEKKSLKFEKQFQLEIYRDW